MKKQVGIWLDTDKAVLVSLLNGNEEVKTIKSQIDTRLRFPGERKPGARLGTMAADPTTKITNRKKQLLHHYFNDIIHSVSDATGILVFGPSKAKIELEKQLKKHHGFDHAHLDVESADKMTTRQLIAHVKKHFKINGNVK